MNNQKWPLLQAALHGDLPRLQRALAEGADPATESAGGLGPLHAAAVTGLAAAVPLLAAAGADVNGRVHDCAACLDREICGSAVAMRKLLSVVSELVDGATPLHVAAALGKAAVVQALLDAGEWAMPGGWLTVWCTCTVGKAVPWKCTFDLGT